MAEEGWERKALEALAHDIVQERRRARRWSIFFRFLAFGIVVLGLLMFAGAFATRAQVCLDRCTALVDLNGEMDRDGRASAEVVIEGLHAAFDNPRIKGVVLRINSPGGSPVQAGRIYAEMKRLRAKHPDIPLHAVVEEMAASGGYYVAAAADRIYVDPASLVGSIGVVIDSFGFVGAMEKLGVERRAITAGENKAFLDPFSPLPEKQRAYAESMLEDVHRQFVAAVKEGRGDRLKETPEMFSGLVWNGQRAVELGLADAYGSVETVARDVFEAEEVVDFTPQEDIASRIAHRLGTEAGRFTLRALRSASFERPALR